MPKRIVFLMSDTGGGHRAAAEAIRDAIFERYGPDSMHAELVDVYKHMSFPANKMPEFYPWIVSNSTFAWSVAYRLGDSPKRARLASRSPTGLTVRTCARSCANIQQTPCAASTASLDSRRSARSTRSRHGRRG